MLILLALLSSAVPVTECFSSCVGRKTSCVQSAKGYRLKLFPSFMWRSNFYEKLKATNVIVYVSICRVVSVNKANQEAFTYVPL